MAILDSRREIDAYDKSHLLSSIEDLPKQIADAWQQVEALPLAPQEPRPARLVVAGMGGSALGGLLLKDLLSDKLTLPLEVCRGYTLPAYVDRASLVMLSSYSGNTEETLSCAKEALERRAQVVVMTTGGELENFALAHELPLYKIDARYNQSGQPRMAIGYMVVGLLALLHKLGLVTVNQTELTDLVARLPSLIAKLSPESSTSSAKLLAYNTYDKTVVLVAAEHLVGAVHITNNQLNENAKVLTAEWPLPEFNHHYMEGLSHPTKLREDVYFLLYNSSLYSPALTKRVKLTRAVIADAGYEVEVIQATAPTKLEQAFEIVTLGSFLSLYLAMLYKIDPSPVPRVDWFKSKMQTSG